MKNPKKTLLTLLLAVFSVSLSAQEPAGRDYVFRFVPGRDMFYIPWQGNDSVLSELTQAVAGRMERLRQRQMYICVASYAATPADSLPAGRMGYLRANRVKSELIVRAGVTEAMFVTERSLSGLYLDSLRDVVVVTFPASAAKVAEIAGAEAAASVEAYNKGQVGKAEPEQTANVQAEAEKRRQEEQTRLVAEREAAKRAEEQRLAAGQAEQEPVMDEEPAQADTEKSSNETAKITGDYTFALRANLLRWATLTPDVGIEWRIDRNVGIAVNGMWTSWSWDDKNRRYALWEVAPEVRYYTGKEKRCYIGAMFKAGEFNYKLSDTGKQGDLLGGGIVGGYQLRLNKALSLDFGLGLGYIRADYDKYTVTDGVRVRSGSGTKNWWGPTSASITLKWNLF